MTKLNIVQLFLAIIIVLFNRDALSRDYSAWLENCSQYRETVESILDDEGVNKDYYYLMVAESRCRKGAASNKGAKGFWQLMPATSKHYGCLNPENVECSTRAAAKYLKKLIGEFDQFEDVIAAYNIGGHNYIRIGMTNEAKWLIVRVKSIKKTDKEVEK